MQRLVHSGDTSIVFTVKRSRRRTVALRVQPSGVITVYAPHSVWGPFIDRFVRQQTAWILKKLAYFKERAVTHPPAAPVSAEQRQIYTGQTQERLNLSIARLAEQLGVRPRSVRVANQNSRWGSCSARGDLRFSWRMATLPDTTFDYVVIHELAHLKVMNHSRRFWVVVESLCPQYKSHRKSLRQA